MSTPIETNTEELQEVLQQVYNLPSRSGGSAWDMTIRCHRENSDDFGVINITTSDIAVDPTEVANTLSKIGNGESVNVRMLGRYCYGSLTTFGMFTPSHIEYRNDLHITFVVGNDYEPYIIMLEISSYNHEVMNVKITKLATAT